MLPSSEVHALGNGFNSLKKYDDVNTYRNMRNGSTMSGTREIDEKNGSFIVTDSLPKAEYYMTLRKNRSIDGLDGRFSDTNLMENGASTFMISREASNNNNTMGSLLTNVASSMNTLSLGHRTNSLKPPQWEKDYKPSGKMVACRVSLLNGEIQLHRIDKACYGQQLFDSVCNMLHILEREYFGLTFYENPKKLLWLENDKKLSKQIPKKREWDVEFRVRFYPYDLQKLEDPLTFHFFCLQLRQDIIAGELTCSFYTMVTLCANIVQSEAGDFNPDFQGIDYLKNQPLVPPTKQTIDFLHAVRECHKQLNGLSPEQADMNFLENAKKLANYGMHIHYIKDGFGKANRIGVNHEGIVVMRDYLRVRRITWPSMIKFAYDKCRFVVEMRNSYGQAFSSYGVRESINGGGVHNGHVSIGLMKRNSKHVWGRDGESLNAYVQAVPNSRGRQVVEFRCFDMYAAKKLHNDCIEHHRFFRLRCLQHRRPTLPQSTVKRYRVIEPTPTDGMIISGHRQHQRQLLSSSGRSSSSVQRLKSRMSSRSAEASELSGRAPSFNGNTISRIPKTEERPNISRIHWLLSHSDRTSDLIINDNLVLKSHSGYGWQGCRANRGVRGQQGVYQSQKYYYEAEIIGSDAAPTSQTLVRVGWSTNTASLALGEDMEGYSMGANEKDQGVSKDQMAFKMHGGFAEPYGHYLQVGDVIGCYLDLGLGEIHYSVNGEHFNKAFTLPNNMLEESFFPTLSANGCFLRANFGESRFRHSPSNDYIGLSQADPDFTKPNKLQGWVWNNMDATEDCQISADGLFVQSTSSSPTTSNWEACRASLAVMGSAPVKYMFEVSCLEGAGACRCRVGVGTHEADLLCGYRDHLGCSWGVDNDELCLEDSVGAVVHEDGNVVFGGPVLQVGDVVTVMLDLPQKTIGWAVNGNVHAAVQVNLTHRLHNQPLFPMICLKGDCTLQTNFGDTPFLFPLNHEEWRPLSKAIGNTVYRTRRKGANLRHRLTRILPDASELDVQQAENFIWAEKENIAKWHSEHTSAIVDQQGNLLRPSQSSNEKSLNPPIASSTSPTRSALSGELASKLRSRMRKTEVSENASTTTTSKMLIGERRSDVGASMLEVDERQATMNDSMETTCSHRNFTPIDSYERQESYMMQSRSHQCTVTTRRCITNEVFLNPSEESMLDEAIRSALGVAMDDPECLDEWVVDRVVEHIQMYCPTG